MNPNLKAFLQGFFFCLLLTAASLLIKTKWFDEVVQLDLNYYLGHLVICIICGIAVVFISKQKRKKK
ncbi:MAG: hypothetical protein EOP00_08390 [Pedobacter sp.]|nr:MAG: hypothetical protein EOP00_08390 [Pedobacter sp.]